VVGNENCFKIVQVWLTRRFRTASKLLKKAKILFSGQKAVVLVQKLHKLHTADLAFFLCIRFQNFSVNLPPRHLQARLQIHVKLFLSQFGQLKRVAPLDNTTHLTLELSCRCHLQQWEIKPRRIISFCVYGLFICAIKLTSWWIRLCTFVSINSLHWWPLRLIIFIPLCAPSTQSLTHLNHTTSAFNRCC